MPSRSAENKNVFCPNALNERVACVHFKFNSEIEKRLMSKKRNVYFWFTLETVYLSSDKVYGFD